MILEGMGVISQFQHSEAESWAARCVPPIFKNKFESIFGGRKIAKIYDRNIIEQLLKLYNK